MGEVFPRRPDTFIAGAPKGGTTMLLDAVCGSAEFNDTVSESEFFFHTLREAAGIRQRAHKEFHYQALRTIGFTAAEKPIVRSAH